MHKRLIETNYATLILIDHAHITLGDPSPNDSFATQVNRHRTINTFVNCLTLKSEVKITVVAVTENGDDLPQRVLDCFGVWLELKNPTPDNVICYWKWSLHQGSIDDNITEDWYKMMSEMVEMNWFEISNSIGHVRSRSLIQANHIDWEMIY